jgi:hypothetical protein
MRCVFFPPPRWPHLDGEEHRSCAHSVRDRGGVGADMSRISSDISENTLADSRVRAKIVDGKRRGPCAAPPLSLRPWLRKIPPLCGPQRGAREARERRG